MFSLQENATTSPDVSALERVWHTPGYPRFIYGVYAILGIIFFGICLYSVLGLLMFFLNGGSILTLGTLLSLCYILINTIIGYGFMFYRKWLIIAFSNSLVLIGLLATFFFSTGGTPHAMVLLTSVFMTAGILLFLFLTKHLLSGRYFVPLAVVPFVALLLFSLLLTNFDMLH